MGEGRREEKRNARLFAEPRYALYCSPQPSWAYLPPGRGQPLQSPHEAARILEALQVLLIGGDLQGRERKAVGWPIPDP